MKLAKNKGFTLIELMIVIAIIATTFWLTIVGANYPSQMIANVLFALEERGADLFQTFGTPWWITGFLWNGA